MVVRRPQGHLGEWHSSLPVEEPWHEINRQIIITAKVELVTGP